MDMCRLLQNTTEVASNMKVEGVAAIAINPLPLNARTELLGRSYQFDWNGFLAGANEDDDVTAFVQARKIHLSHVLEINEQELFSQRYFPRPGLNA